ncbi:MAG: methyltransferase domain-containing protein [Flavobacteriales bacterium]|nr:methyltransferase domain-containing protein [Flavobacteriales bacterium]
MQRNELIALLEDEIVQEFISLHGSENPEFLALNYRQRVDFDISKVTQLLQLYKKAQHKLPLWILKRCAMNAKNYEQCSSEETARFKASLFAGKKMLDMTCGLGVDSYFFSRRFEQVVSLEAHTETFEYAKYNANKLGASNIEFVNENCENYELSETYDLIYIDPDRRPEGMQKREYSLQDYSPDMTIFQDTLWPFSEILLIKVSPMLDISMILNQLKWVKTIYVVAVKNEVKELLICAKNNFLGDAEIIAVDIQKEQTSMYSKTASTSKMKYSDAGKYLIEPSKAIIKSGLAANFAMHHSFGFLAQNGLYFFSDSFDSIPGQCRAFEILHTFVFSWKEIKSFIKKEKIKALNIAQRHFFEDVASIRKRLQIPEGGKNFLFFSKNQAENPVCYYAKPIDLE